MTELKPVTLQIVPLEVPEGEPQTWLPTLWGAEEGILLSHLDDGVVWGRITKGDLELPPGTTPLRRMTLQDLRLFSENLEVRVFRNGEGGLKAVKLLEAGGEHARAYSHSLDREYLLLGEEVPSAKAPEGFDYLGALGGQHHLVPADARMLLVRHYYEQDKDTGLLRETAHRWMALLKKEERR